MRTRARIGALKRDILITFEEVAGSVVQLDKAN